MNKSQIAGELRKLTIERFAPRPVEGLECMPIHDFDLADGLSTASEREAGSKYQPWADLRPETDEKYASEAGREFPLKKKTLLDRLVVIIASFYAYDLESKLGKTVIGSVPVSRVADDFSALYMYALATVDSGTTERLYEDMFLAYQSGGWPCGWLGKYPEGKIVVFYPS